MCDGDGEAGVCGLEIGGEAEVDGIEGGVSVDDVEGCWGGICALLEDRGGGRGLRGGEAGSAGFHDAGFVPGDFLDGVS